MSGLVKRTWSQDANALKGELNRRKTLSASRDGLTFEQAARRCGLKETGLRNLLYREFGSKQWPIVEQDT